MIQPAADLPAATTIALSRRNGLTQAEVRVRWRPTHRLEWRSDLIGGGVTSVMAVAAADGEVELWTRQEAANGGRPAWVFRPFAGERDQLHYRGAPWPGECSMRALGTAPGRGKRR